ncbi:sugar transferase [Natronococcus sp. A-GB1]|uniref:sugar transferase n=1 Tax=Natronococcus sp. A-GB1 TaxID=3037648 RepID=UPI00241C7931|nr:sugar transferase [Natronococcus sp. A-GB1]MDG5759870.1 sugar transferase [Natronococcus sp. A-GB1]
MLLRWGYRGAAATGTLLLALAAGFVAGILTGVPTTLGESLLAAVLVGGVVSVALTPLYVSRPRSVATVLSESWRQIGIACLVLIALAVTGVPPAPAVSTSLVSGALLALALPAWYGLCRRRNRTERVLVVGDEPTLIKSSVLSLPVSPLGFLSPVLTEQSIEMSYPGDSVPDRRPDDEQILRTDGGLRTDAQLNRLELIAGTKRLGGLSRLERVIQERDIDTVVLAFAHGDREECFGVLRTCREQGVDALVHDSLADSVLEDEPVGDALVRVDLQPWPWYGRLTKRAFDLTFATVGLFVLAPIILLVAVAVKLDSPGPVLYNQVRTSTLGQTFTLSKFRSMVTDAESDGAELSDEDAGSVDPRVTGVGRVLRKTHLDEIPQLFSILNGEMSVVGPRPERPEIDREIETDGIDWSKRWFVKPGLTGIAQINDVTGFEPAKKLEYDLEYVRRRSLWLDVRLVAAQIWSVTVDVVDLLSERLTKDGDEESSSS